MKRIKRLALAMVGMMTVGVAVPTFAVASLPCGWYAEGNVGSVTVSDVSYGDDTSAKVSGVGWNVNGGYKFMPFFGIDLGYTRYTNGNISIDGVNFAQVNSRYSYQLAGKGILPLCDTGVELFAKLGIARLVTSLETTDSDIADVVPNYSSGSRLSTGAYFGAGAGYNFTPSLAANIQWSRAAGNNNTGRIDLLSVGMSFIFT